MRLSGIPRDLRYSTLPLELAENRFPQAKKFLVRESSWATFSRRTGSSSFANCRHPC